MSGCSCCLNFLYVGVEMKKILARLKQILEWAKIIMDVLAGIERGKKEEEE